jgi:hypothetical protein
MSETEKTFLPLTSLVPWKDNPRDIEEEELIKLKDKLVRLGQYKPLIVTVDGDTAVVIGGNQRIKAMELAAEEKGVAFDQYQVWVSVVEAPTDVEKLEYALVDNESAGTTNQQKLGELLSRPEFVDFDIDRYRVQIDENVDLGYIIDSYRTTSFEEDEETERAQILTVLPPESPNLKERVAIKFDDLDEYERVKEAIQEQRISAKDILKLL